MKNKLSILTVAVLCIGILSGCKSAPIKPDNPFNGRVTDSRPLRLLNQGKPQEAADYYSSRAQRSSNAEQQQDYQLLSAEILFDRGMLEPGLEKLRLVPQTLSNLELQHRREILVAKSLMFGGQPAEALEALPAPEDVLTALDRARVYETRAQSFNRLQDPDNELIARIGLEQQIVNEVIVDKNHQQIWAMLTTQSLSSLRSLTTNVRGDTYQGWVALAMLNADAGNNERLRTSKLSQWRDLYAEHPANARFVPLIYSNDESIEFQAPADGSINTIAVLLPFSYDRTTNVVNALRDGIVAAHQFASDEFNRPILRFYDIGDDPAYVRTAYENAIADGADAIIGPLRKQAVSAIVTLRDTPVPTITLNTVDASLTYGGGQSQIIQFGLAPEDEARSAASRAIGLSLNNAIILQADDARGDREARAFQDEMFAYGGNVVHVAVLPEDQYDYSTELKDALQITQSDQRFKTLSSVIEQKLFFEPSIRNDVDVVFLAIGTEQARSVRPQLDFFHASNIPRLGTSRIAAPDDNIKNNRDLNSIFYPDAPWILRKSMRNDPLRKQILTTFPNAEGVYAKLYALGADAYRVINNLGPLSQGQRLEGFTGDLELSNGRIVRHLDWAQYQEGVSVGVKRVEASELPAIQSGVAN